MRLLIDTHVVVWLAADKRRLTDRVLRALSDNPGDVSVSVISAWEYEMKRRKQPDRFPIAFDTVISAAGFYRLDFPFACHKDAEALPYIHRDPFDRMLIAHARYLQCPLVTSDSAIMQYPVETIW
ncbi:MAG: type II toxin-antitoxin system VapC family toxin [Pontixanthobacter sp.]